MTPDQLLRSALTDSSAPAGLSSEALTLWLIKAGRWEEAHNIAQEIPSRTGSWLHALLHLMEGDIGNAGYWFARAGRSAVPVTEINTEWQRLADAILPASAP